MSRSTLLNWVKQEDAFKNSNNQELPNLYKVISKHNWAKRRFYIKLDIKQWFFNIPLHPLSQKLTTFEYRGVYYAFKVLPFGMSLAPFVAQTLLNSILKKIRVCAPMSWGHIDDILISDRSARKLRILAFRLKAWFKKAKLPIKRKSILEPRRTIKFLGAKWGAGRSKKIEEDRKRSRGNW